MKEVFDWCTDFRDDDPQKVHARPTHKMKVLEKTAQRVKLTEEWVENGRGMKETATIYLHPPDRWNMESSGDMWDSRAAYRLTPEGDKTRIVITLDEVFKVDPHPKPEDTAKWLSDFWDTILDAFYAETGRSKNPRQ
jgi:hypothetical protein